MIDLLAGFAGVAIVMLVSADVFRSLLVPRAATRALRLGPILGGALFPVWQALANRLGDESRRQTVRASLAPLLLVLSLVIWAGLLILGYGLIFHALRDGFSPRPRGIGDAVFAAAAAFSTLGAPAAVTGTGARFAVIACALSGFSIVTVVATFLISVQGGFSRREALVLRLEAHVFLPPEGVSILETYAREGVTDRLGAFFDAWEAWAADVALSHRAYPILIFFRSNDSRCEWLSAIGAVLDAAALLDTAVADAPPAARAGAHFTLRTGSRMLRDIAGELGVEPGAAAVAPDRYAAYRARLADCGYALEPDEAAGYTRFTERRATFAPTLDALARRLRVTVDDHQGERRSGPRI